MIFLIDVGCFFGIMTSIFPPLPAHIIIYNTMTLVPVSFLRDTARVRKTFNPSSEPNFDSEPSSHIF